MLRVLGIDPGTVSIDLCGLVDGHLAVDRTDLSADALTDPAKYVSTLAGIGPWDLIAGPSGYGLPLVEASGASEEDLRLAYLAGPDESGGIGGLRRLARALGESGLPVLFTPGVLHLPTVPTHRKLNRVDLGTAEKVAVAALAIWDQMRRLACRPAETSFILLELGGGFTAGLAVQAGKIIDGIGGTSGPIGWGSSGAWDGEVAYLAQSVTKEMLFRGGAQDARRQGEDVSVAAYQEGAAKAILTLTATLPAPREILLSGRHARDPGLADSLSRRLQAIAPVRHLMGFAKVAKEGAQGAAILAEGLAGGQHATLVETMALRQASGSVLDHLLVIDSAQARRRLGLS